MRGTSFYFLALRIYWYVVNCCREGSLNVFISVSSFCSFPGLHESMLYIFCIFRWQLLNSILMLSRVKKRKCVTWLFVGKIFVIARAKILM